MARRDPPRHPLTSALIRVVQRATLLLAALAGSFLLAEGFVRLTMPAFRAASSDRQFWEHHPTLGWAHLPGTVGRLKTANGVIEIRINSAGLRESEEIPERKPPGKLRMVFLGDSYAWGYGVEERERLGELLEAAYSWIRTVDLGVSGYSTDQELLLFERLGARYEANLVVLMFSANDLVGNVSGSQYGYAKPLFVSGSEGLTLTNVPVPRPSVSRRLGQALRGRSALLNAVRSSLWRLRREEPQPWDRERRRPDKSGPEGESESAMAFALIERLRSRVNEQGAQLVVVVNPSSAVRAEPKPKVAKLLRRLEQQGIPVLDLYPAFRRAESGKLFQLDGHHWTALAYCVAADELVEFLSDHRLLPAGESVKPAGVCAPELR